MTLREQSRLPPGGVDAYLIWPRGGNTGDALIVDACERFLHDRGIDVWRSDGSLEQAALADDVAYLQTALANFRGMLMFPGGGNIGIYPDNGAIRASILAHAGSRQRCLIFSQSALQAEPALVDQRVTVWCRDAVSLAILRQAGTKVELVPDMALYMDGSIAQHPKGDGIFFIKRKLGRDAESLESSTAVDAPQADLTFENSLNEVVATLKRYEVIISNRLHGGLIALMMRKKTVLLPVAYHKSRSFYHTWLSSFPGVTFVETLDRLNAHIAAIQAPNCNLRELFCRHAFPAFDRFLMRRQH
jgi:exopolysaccharide biosynthesis predicted pyruvyltransferase EpsI